jgi:hypothetical protein
MKKNTGKTYFSIKSNDIFGAESSQSGEERQHRGNLWFHVFGQDRGINPQVETRQVCKTTGGDFQTQD